jgi:5'-AMP-activated protein kinase catalytic alpha subunit
MENPPDHLPKKIGDYILGKTLGKGTFGKVKIGTHEPTSEKVAIKILEKQKIKDTSDIERVTREIHILKLIRHPNIIQLYEIIETSRKLYLIMEYASGGELFDYIVNKSRLDESEACRFFHQIISGVEYIHQLGIVHRDLKPENMLLDDDKNIKIVDFGLSNTYNPAEMLQTACGSPCYAAPEMIAGNKYHGLKVDLWSCGVILFAMISGFLPFEDPVTANLYKKILTCEYSVPGWVSENAQNMLRNILDTNPDTRATIQRIRSHSWFNKVKSEFIQGIHVGINQMPINKELLKKLNEFGFDPFYCQKCIEANTHDQITTTYYLLMKKFKAPLGVPQKPKDKSWSLMTNKFNSIPLLNLSENFPKTSNFPVTGRMKSAIRQTPRVVLDNSFRKSGKNRIKSLNRTSRALASDKSPLKLGPIKRLGFKRLNKVKGSILMKK